MLGHIWEEIYCNITSEFCLSVDSRPCVSLAGFTVLNNLSYLYIYLELAPLTLIFDMSYQILHSLDAHVGKAVALLKSMHSHLFWHNEFVICSSPPANMSQAEKRGRGQRTPGPSYSPSSPLKQDRAYISRRLPSSLGDPNLLTDGSSLLTPHPVHFQPLTPSAKAELW